ncbi:MAG: phosphatidylserine decarboxylase family protein [Planctomycetes bacterium]|nr:phosphatidylserine decarboxylase family protein [Planctomycetota bacterium]
MGLAKEGMNEVIGSAMLLGAMAWGATWIHWALAIPPILVLLWVVWFFRDPNRDASHDDNVFIAPADGTVTEITRLDHHELVNGPAIRVGIFLSIFNVHINRSPCAGTVRDVTYQPGKFLDARHEDAGRLNESNTLVIDPQAPLTGPIVVRQVAGLIARRIICHAEPQSTLVCGERFGLIKFGSRTELIVPDTEGIEVAVSVGDKVNAGQTLLMKVAQ